MFKSIISLVLALGLCAPVWGDTLQLREDAPQRYVVKKGDTLWDISAKYLRSPWQWPQLWRMNRDEVRNPHLIYPGDTLALEMVDGQPSLRISGNRVVKLSPQVRSQPLDAAIDTIPAKLIDPFLKRPLLLDDTVQYQQAPRIVAGPDNRVILSSSDTAYANQLDAGGVWQAFRLGRPLVDPDSGEQLGHEVTYGGDLLVERMDTVSTLRVGKVTEEILVGDRLMRAYGGGHSQYVPHEAPAGLSGRIVLSVAGVNEIGQLDNVVINRGQREGVEVGHVFGIFRAPRSVKISEQQSLTLPSEQVGELIVYRVFAKAAYALVVGARQAIAVGDRVAKPQ